MNNEHFARKWFFYVLESVKKAEFSIVLKRSTFSFQIAFFDSSSSSIRYKMIGFEEFPKNLKIFVKNGTFGGFKPAEEN